MATKKKLPSRNQLAVMHAEEVGTMMELITRISDQVEDLQNV